MTKPANTISFEMATKISWDGWIKFLDATNALEMDHTELAQHIYNKMDFSQKSRGWWAQSIAVAYEQHIGRRVPGQSPDGLYEISASKTFDGSMDEALIAWQKLTANKREFNGSELEGKPKVSQTEKWRYWRLGLRDGSKISIDIYQKSPEKSSLSVSHAKLESPQAAEHWRTFWKKFLQTL